MWQATVDNLETVLDGRHKLTVRAGDSAGKAATETLRVLVNRAGEAALPLRSANGSDSDSVGAWREKGILGSQLGPNRNGKKW